MRTRSWVYPTPVRSSLFHTFHASESDLDGLGLADGKKDKGLGAPPVAALLAAVLQDAQTRLFFRAQAAIQTEIRGFTPKDADLAYPAILLGAPRLYPPSRC